MTILDANGNDVELLREQELLRRLGIAGYMLLKETENLPLDADDAAADIVWARENFSPQGMEKLKKEGKTAVFFAPGVLEAAVKNKK